MKKNFSAGFSFGLTSGVITTLGLMIGLLAGTNSKIAVISGILTIAIADALSDALGMHISAESDARNNNKQVWTVTATTFFSKLFFASTFILPVLFFPLGKAAVISLITVFVNHDL